MTGQMFRARCPVCGVRVGVKKNGTLRIHFRQGVTCPGSGEGP